MGQLKKLHHKKLIFCGLSTSESGVFWAISQIICENPPVKRFALNDINDILKFTKPNLSQTINKLEDKGLVKREISKEDRRATYIVLTKKGVSICEKSNNDFLDFLNSIVEKMGDEDVDKFIGLWNKFIGALEEFEVEYMANSVEQTKGTNV